MMFTYRASLISRSIKDVVNAKFVAPYGTSVEDRLESLVDRTADDIKQCLKNCDTYTK